MQIEYWYLMQGRLYKKVVLILYRKRKVYFRISYSKEKVLLKVLSISKVRFWYVKFRVEYLKTTEVTIKL